MHGEAEPAANLDERYLGVNTGLEEKSEARKDSLAQPTFSGLLDKGGWPGS